jgi:ElaB/YqjD/DUF883 family membrane-anchored ribosome-binding protein
MNNRTPVTKALRKARDLFDDSREAARDGASQAKSFIHHRPLLSTFLGLGVGILIGHWIRSRD